MNQNVKDLGWIIFWVVSGTGVLCVAGLILKHVLHASNEFIVLVVGLMGIPIVLIMSFKIIALALPREKKKSRYDEILK